MKLSNGFTKQERLCNNTQIDALFAHGNRHIASFPIRIVWRISNVEPNHEVSILISVPKRNLRHAVDRNRTKRQIREFYRLNSHSLRALMAARGQTLHLAFLFMDKRLWSTQSLNTKLTAVMSRLLESLKNQSQPQERSCNDEHKAEPIQST